MTSSPEINMPPFFHGWNGPYFWGHSQVFDIVQYFHELLNLFCVLHHSCAKGVYLFHWPKFSTDHTLSFFQDMGDDAAALFAALTLRCGQLRTLRSLLLTEEETGFLGENWER